VALIGQRSQQAAQLVLVEIAVSRMFLVAPNVGERIRLGADAEPTGELEQRVGEALHSVGQRLVARPRDLVDDRERVGVLDVVDALAPDAGQDVVAQLLAVGRLGGGDKRRDVVGDEDLDQLADEWCPAAGVLLGNGIAPLSTSMSTSFARLRAFSVFQRGHGPILKSLSVLAR
jgi:hypothetical protein